MLHIRLHSEYDSRFDLLVSVVWGGGGGGVLSFSYFSCIDTRGYRFTYCFGHPSNILLHLTGLFVRQFLMLSIVFNSVLVQSFCHDSS